MKEEPKEWRRLAKRLARFINFAWWIERWNALLLIGSLLGAGAILILRNQRIELIPSTSLMIVGAVLALLALTAWLLTRRRFIHLGDAYVRLEKELHLHNALSTARAGVGPWPAPPSQDPVRAGYNWHWSRVIAPSLIACSLLAGAFLIPVRPLSADDQAGPEEPPAWEDIDSWLKELEEETAADETDLDRAAERIAQLRNQPEEEWYSHSSMEATDTLKQQLAESIRRLEKNSTAANRSLSALRNHSSQLSEANRQRLTSEYNEALQGMQSGGLRPNSSLLNSLENVDLNNLSSLSPSQLKQLSDALKKTSGSCGQCLGGMGTPAGWRNDADLLSESGAGSPGARFPDGSRIKRGPGSAPISLSGDPSELGTNNLEEVASKDYSRAAFGDVLALGEGEHDIDKNTTGPASAGAVRSAGKGGERIWRESLLPSEREVLGRYFK